LLNIVTFIKNKLNPPGKKQQNVDNLKEIIDEAQCNQTEAIECIDSELENLITEINDTILGNENKMQRVSSSIGSLIFWQYFYNLPL